MAALQLRQLQVGSLKPIDLDIKAGECVCISGASGTGKTRLLRAIVDLDPHEGDARINDESCTAMCAHRWRRRVGYLPAESQWWGETVKEHFTPRARPAYAAVGFTSGIATRKVAELSTGERQRLAMLRLLANAPEVLLLDEPTSGLDAVTRSKVERLIAAYRRRHKAAVLWVSHDSTQIRRVADRHLHLQGGALRAPRRS